MRDTDLFRMALGIEPPWVVTKSEFDAAAKRLDIHLDFAKGSRFAWLLILNGADLLQLLPPVPEG